MDSVQARARADRPDGEQLKPSAMRGNETRYGWVVGLELAVVAVFNLTLTHGAGAPATPQTALSVVGLVAAIAFLGLLQTKNRMIVGFASIIAAFFITLPKVPSALQTAHIFALLFPLVYTLLLTQRQRRQATAEMKARRGQAPPARQSRKKRNEPEPPSGPQKSARYTPPKSKRPTGKSSSGRGSRR